VTIFGVPAAPAWRWHDAPTIGDDLRFVAWHVGACVISLAVVVFLAVVLCLWACVAVVRLHVKTARRQQRQRRTLASADRSGHTEGRR